MTIEPQEGAAAPVASAVASAVASSAARHFAFASGIARGLSRPLAVEAPVNLIYGGIPFAVMMASPQDLEDFALGFSLTEGIIRSPKEMRAMSVTRAEDGIRVAIDLSGEALSRHLSRIRNVVGRTGCGLCGIEDLADLPQAGARQVAARSIALSAIERALAGLEAAQALNTLTRAVHGAAWFDADGALVALREDVGRHNALDKLIGAVTRGGVDPGSGFLVITSRCSYEMVEKAAILGAPTLVAISAPTALAVARAQAHGMTLLALARPDGVTAFTHGERVLCAEAAA